MQNVTTKIENGKKRNDRSKEKKIELSVRYFDETVGLDPSIRLMLNERILEVEK